METHIFGFFYLGAVGAPLSHFQKAPLLTATSCDSDPGLPLAACMRSGCKCQSINSSATTLTQWLMGLEYKFSGSLIPHPLKEMMLKCVLHWIPHFPGGLRSRCPRVNLLNSTPFIGRLQFSVSISHWTLVPRGSPAHKVDWLECLSQGLHFGKSDLYSKHIW